MNDKTRRDKNFKKLCRWMHEAAEVAEILKEECQTVASMDGEGADKKAPYSSQGVHSALELMNFISCIADNPLDYQDENPAEEQRNLYPDAAFGFMLLALMTGQMHVSDESRSIFGE